MNMKTLEIAIGVVFFFTFASLLCSAVRELVEAWLNKKGKLLEQALREILNDEKVSAEKGKESILVKFYRHPLIDSLFREDIDKSLRETAPLRSRFWNTLPGNIPAQHFAAALLDVLAPAARRVTAAESPISKSAAPPQGQGAANAPQGQPQNTVSATPVVDPKKARFEEIRAAIVDSDDLKKNERLKAAVIWALDHADGDVDKALKSLELWFENSMERVTGWYKRNTAAWLFLIGLVTAFLLNLDTLNVIQRLYIDDEWRKAIVESADGLAKNEAFVKRLCSTPEVSPEPTLASTTPAGDQGAAAQRNEAAKECVVTQVDLIEKEMRDAHLPIGWTEGSWNAFWRDLSLWQENARARLQPVKTRIAEDASLVAELGKGVRGAASSAARVPAAALDAKAPAVRDPNAKPGPFSPPSVASGMILGWIITAFAMTFGASFWFDLLGKLVDLRSSLKPSIPAAQKKEP